MITAGNILMWTACAAVPGAVLYYLLDKDSAGVKRTRMLLSIFIIFMISVFITEALVDATDSTVNLVLKIITAVAGWSAVISLIRYVPETLPSSASHDVVKNLQEGFQPYKSDATHAIQSTRIAQLGYWEWYPETNKMFWSDTMWKIFGLTPQSAVPDFNFYTSMVHPEELTDVGNKRDRGLKDGKIVNYLRRIVTNDGQTRTLLMNTEAVRTSEGKTEKLIGTAQDFTEFHFNEEKLKVQNRRLEYANNELQKFTYVASHDLQEPLRKIISFNSRLETEFEGSLNGKAGYYLEKINDAALRMQQLVLDILKFSRLSAMGHLHTRTDLNEILKLTLNDLEPAIAGNQAVITSDPLPLIECNAVQMQQLFNNLLSNSIKFHHPDRPPVIRITHDFIQADVNEYGIQQSRMLRLRIEDNGIGFEESYAERIFNAFQRLHSRKAYEGTGIGLAICRKITENHRGTITAAGMPGQGSVFTVTLPIKQPQD